MQSNNFIFSWVLKNKLGLGSAPTREDNIFLLKEKKIQFILNLCNKDEFIVDDKIKENFEYINYPLVDHKSNEDIKISQIIDCIEIIKNNAQKKIFVHCLASIERSPIVCLSYLINQKQLSLEDAFIYLSQIHKTFNPLNRQLKVISDNISLIR